MEMPKTTNTLPVTNTGTSNGVGCAGVKRPFTEISSVSAHHTCDVDEHFPLVFASNPATAKQLQHFTHGHNHNHNHSHSQSHLTEHNEDGIRRIRPLVSAEIIVGEQPASPAARHTIAQGRTQCAEILRGGDDRLVVVVGPCSIHDEAAAYEYAKKLHSVTQRFAPDLLLIMRVYFEKPRTVVGWKGLINDPHLDGSCKINAGLRLARRILLNISEMGVPTAGEFLDTFSPAYVADLISWGAIGARTTESQVHRQLASGLNIPIGFKNSTNGSVGVAIDGVRSASHSHSYMGLSRHGHSSIIETKGNPNCHVILRGSAKRTNYEREHVEEAVKHLQAHKLTPKLMIDCSHDNSRKDYRNQPSVAENIAVQIENGSHDIFGVMIESNLFAGKQDIHPEGLSKMKFGQSVTDGCVGWDETVSILERLAQAVRKRRAFDSSGNSSSD